VRDLFLIGKKAIDSKGKRAISEAFDLVKQNALPQCVLDSITNIITFFFLNGAEAISQASPTH